MTFSVIDRKRMARALQLANKGLYTTDPNPRVGCVITNGNLNGREEIIGEGWHVRAGEGHAEVNALAQAGENAKGSTAYVTLEPCSHFGRTPPCAVGLIDAGVTKVIAAMVDPNPQVAGRGLEMLRAQGIETSAGLLENEAKALNPGFIKRMETGLPQVRIKMASSLDGRTAMASGESQWITGPDARGDVQKLRAQSSVIVTGIESILLDDSSLTVREAELDLPNASEIVKQQPLRVVLDSSLRMPVDAKILKQPGRTLIATCSDDRLKKEKLESGGAQIIVLPSEEGRVPLRALLKWLADEEQCNELLVETGATLAGEFIKQGLVDEIQLYMAMKLLGSDARPVFTLPLSKMSEQVELRQIDSCMLGDDLKLVLQPVYGDK
jgi:diaminohydroxyphosphoribosylaminopyrimidine deaminase/5-amino-6-(5-phosphoribosylamino)uracil reductase